MAQLVKALRSHRRDPWFESRCAHVLLMPVLRNPVFRHKNPMRRFYLAAALAGGAGPFLLANAVVASSCFTIASPREGTVISSPLCTVSVAACNQVNSINVVAHFELPGDKGDTALLLGHITHPPFKLLWNTDGIPNQLFTGMSFSAEATMRSGERVTHTVGGVFIANKPFVSPVAFIPFSLSAGSVLFSRMVSGAQMPLGARVSAAWSLKGVRFLVRATAPIAFGEANTGLLARAGCEICIDPGPARAPYPSQKAFSIVIPLFGPPVRSLFSPVSDSSGAFHVRENTAPFPLPHKIDKEDLKGFKISATVPVSLFGSQVPDSFGCSVIVRVPGDSGAITTLPWVTAPRSMMLSPFYWGTVKLSPRPFYRTPLILWFLSFGAGLIVALAAGMAFLLIRKRPASFERFEQSEEDKALSDQIYQLIDESITRKDITLHWVGEKMGMTPKKIEGIIRRHKGWSFRDFIMFLRIEIAKERLRSSHSSEASIAESCGFRNVNEMEKYFAKFCHTTPFKIRKENQVA